MGRSLVVVVVCVYLPSGSYCLEQAQPRWNRRQTTWRQERR